MSDSRYILSGSSFPYSVTGGNLAPANIADGRQYICELRMDMSSKRYLLGASGGWYYTADGISAWLTTNTGSSKKMLEVQWVSDGGETFQVEIWKKASPDTTLEIKLYNMSTTPYTQMWDDGFSIAGTLNNYASQKPKDKTLFFTFFIDKTANSDNHEISFGMFSSMMNGQPVPAAYTPANGFYDTIGNGYLADRDGTAAQKMLYSAFDGLSIPDEDLGEEMESSESDFPGDYQYHDEEVDWPDTPVDSALDAGFITLYRTDKTSLQTLGNELWSSSFTETILKNFDSPFDNIIALNILPVTVQGTLTSISIGNYQSAAGGEIIETQFVDLDGGSCEIPKIFGNQLDFEPGTTCEIYIPFIGYRRIDLDDASGGTLRLRYRLDLLTGNLLAMIRVTQNDRYLHDSVEYYFTGNCATSVPISGANYMSMYSNMIGGLHSMGMVVGASAPGLVGLAGVGSAMTSKPSYQRSGSISGNFGLMSQLTAFLLISSPKQGYDYRFKQYAGVRSHMYTSFAALTGFQQIQDYIPDSTLVSACTNEELEEINKLLMEGVIF